MDWTPTPEQTEEIWIARTNDERYRFVQEVFPNEEIDRVHRANCRVLIQLGRLQPAQEDVVPVARRKWNPRVRYCFKSD